jgi:hypothetical protein
MKYRWVLKQSSPASVDTSQQSCHNQDGRENLFL